MNSDQITSAGIIRSNGSIAGGTVRLGSAVIGGVDSTSRTTSWAGATFYGGAPGFNLRVYMVIGDLRVENASGSVGDVITVTLTWNDGAAKTQTFTGIPLQPNGAIYPIVTAVRLSSSSDITATTTLGGGNVGTAQYRLRLYSVPIG